MLSSQKQLPDKGIGRSQRIVFFPELLILFRFTKELLVVMRNRFVGQFIHDEPLSCVFVLLSRSRVVIVFIPNSTFTEYYLPPDSTTYIAGYLHRNLSARCGGIVTLLLTRLCIDMSLSISSVRTSSGSRETCVPRIDDGHIATVYPSMYYFQELNTLSHVRPQSTSPKCPIQILSIFPHNDKKSQ